MRKGYADIPGGQVHYREEGRGEPLLLLHQTPSWSDEYALVIPLLARNYRVIALDTPGFGMSSPTPRPYEIPDYARAVKAFMGALKISKATLVGHHTGSSIAVELAADSPELVSRLVLSGCPHYLPEVRAAKLADPKYTPMEYKLDAGHILKLWNLFHNAVPAAPAEALSKVVVGGLLAGPRGEEAHHAVFRYDIEPRLRALKCPVLLVSGTKDTFFPRLEATRALLPGCKVAVIEGGDPLISLTNPQALAAAILEFLGAPPA
jgi:pimeloyl-ACP methyl ester carboxylesterase